MRCPDQSTPPLAQVYREFFIDKLLVLVHFIIVMIRWTGLAPLEFEFPFPGSLASTFLGWPSMQSHPPIDSLIFELGVAAILYLRTRILTGNYTPLRAGAIIRGPLRSFGPLGRPPASPRLVRPVPAQVEGYRVSDELGSLGP